VRTALIHDGVDASRLTAHGFGQTQPIASNDTAEGRLQNRRTAFTVASNAGESTTTTTTETTPAPAQ
jgi:outer membrane protein OmpA-like peptidoglycan-associated protein